MSTGDNTDFSKLSGLLELQEAARQLFSAYVLTDEEYRTGRIAPTFTNTSLQLVAATTSQSQDIEAQRAAAIQKLQGAMSKVPLDQRGDLQARIDAVATATQGDQIDALTLEALRDIEAAAQFAATGTNIQDLQSLEDDKKQQLAEQWAQYRADSQKAREEFAAAGYKDSKENEEELKKLWSRMDTLEPGSPEWIKTWQKITTMDEGYFQRVKEEATNRGDEETLRKAAEALNATHKSQADLRVYNEVSSTQLNEETKETAFQKTTKRFGSNNQQSLTQNKSEMQNVSGEVELGNLSPSIAAVNKPSNSQSIG